MEVVSVDWGLIFWVAGTLTGIIGLAWLVVRMIKNRNGNQR